MYAKATSIGEKIPKVFSIFVEQAKVVCPNCWATVELKDLESIAGRLRMLQDCPACGEMFHVENPPKVEIT